MLRSSQSSVVHAQFACCATTKAALCTRTLRGARRVALDGPCAVGAHSALPCILELHAETELQRLGLPWVFAGVEGHRPEADSPRREHDKSADKGEQYGGSAEARTQKGMTQALCQCGQVWVGFEASSPEQCPCRIQSKRPARRIQSTRPARVAELARERPHAEADMRTCL